MKEIKTQTTISLNECPVVDCPVRSAAEKIRNEQIDIENIEKAREIAANEGLECSFVYSSWGRSSGHKDPYNIETPINIVRIADGEIFDADCYQERDGEKVWCGRLIAGELIRPDREFVIRKIWLMREIK